MQHMRDEASANTVHRKRLALNPAAEGLKPLLSPHCSHVGCNQLSTYIYISVIIAHVFFNHC